jgi:hypothetical protein
MALLLGQNNAESTEHRLSGLAVDPTASNPDVYFVRQAAVPPPAPQQEADYEILRVPIGGGQFRTPAIKLGRPTITNFNVRTQMQVYDGYFGLAVTAGAFQTGGPIFYGSLAAFQANGTYTGLPSPAGVMLLNKSIKWVSAIGANLAFIDRADAGTSPQSAPILPGGDAGAIDVTAIAPFPAGGAERFAMATSDYMTKQTVIRVCEFGSVWSCAPLNAASPLLDRVQRLVVGTKAIYAIVGSTTNPEAGALYEIPVMGGSPVVKLLPKAGGLPLGIYFEQGIALSPDERYVFFGTASGMMAYQVDSQQVISLNRKDVQDSIGDVVVTQGQVLWIGCEGIDRERCKIWSTKLPSGNP